MSIREHLLANRTSLAGDSAGATGTSVNENPMGRRPYQQLKMNIHQTVIDRVELDRLQRLSSNEVKRELGQLVEQLIAEQNILMNESERRRLSDEVYDEMLGLGPLEPLLKDPTVSDILVNTAQRVYVERRGQLEITDVTFYDDAHLMKIIERIVSRVGRRIDESSPMVDARLADGSRVNAIIPPSAIDGPLLSIRRFSVNPLTVSDMIENRTLIPEMANLLELLIKWKFNVIISGGTGSGKTTLLNLLSGFIPDGERIVTIEDAAELQLRQNHVVRLETRPPNIEGRGEITQSTLVRNALRMRPDRIVLGEVRGGDALDMLNAMNTGHEGSMATLHANTPRDALTRLENMVSMAGFSMPVKSIRTQIASAITVVLQISRLPDGNRKLMSIQEITGMEGDIINMQELFSFKRTGTNGTGAIEGFFSAAGIRPKFCEKLASYGVVISDHIFDPSRRFIA